MNTFQTLRDINADSNRILTVGTFDGVHKGHQVLIRTVVNLAKKTGQRSAVVTFDPHPRDIIHPGDQGIQLLTTLDERSQKLFELGVDDMIVIPFDRDFSLMSSEEFIRTILCEKIGMSTYVIGYDHQFGRHRKGTIESVKELSQILGFSVRVVSKQEIGKHTVSSTAIRKCLTEQGNCKLASNLLGSPYRLRASVIRGDGRGRVIGFPTANLLPESDRKVIPCNGVYAVWVQVDDRYYGGMMNIGIRPTFHGKDRSLEVHIFDFDKDIYGRPLNVIFADRLRDEMQFFSVTEIRAQLERDKEAARMIVKEMDKVGNRTGKMNPSGSS